MPTRGAHKKRKVGATVGKPTADGSAATTPRRRGMSRRTIETRGFISNVLNEYAPEPMSSRQVAYQLVGRKTAAGDPVIENNEAEKERVGRIIVAMRRDGTIPQDRIVDHTRSIYRRPSWHGVADILRAAAEQYRRDLWTDQATIPIVALEKRALEGVFSRIVDEYGVRLVTFGGFNSYSADYEWSEEIKAITSAGKRVEVLYFGDHDPSGICIEDTSLGRLEDEFGADVGWERLALLPRDLDAYGLARIPVKTEARARRIGKRRGDSRAKDFLSKFGDNAAELDALPPDELARRIREGIERYVDNAKWDALKRVETAERESLGLVLDNWELAVAAVKAGPAAPTSAAGAP